MEAEITSLLTIDELLNAVNGKVVGTVFKDAVFTSVVIDSRNCKKNSLFVPLIGTTRNGHDFIPQCLKSGASFIFAAESEVEKDKLKYENLTKEYKSVIIEVKNTMTALQDAARCYVNKFPSLIKIGITGSSGKTTTKEILGTVLSEKYSVVMNEGNFNSETGLPLSVFNIRPEHEVGIFEMGMNRKNEIAEIAGVLCPSISIITNIGTAHIGILGSQQAIAEEKKNIFSYFSENSVGFVPETDKFADFLCDVKKGSIRKFGLSAFSKNITDVSSSGLDGTVFNYKGSFITFPVPGKHNFSNCLAALSVAEYLHLSVSEIKKGLESVKTIFGRSQVFRGDITLVHDCYNANPDSMDSSITFCDDLEWSGKKIYVIGDMLELGTSSENEHRKIGKRIISSNCSAAFFFGKEMKAAYDECNLKKDQKFYFWSDDIEEIKRQLKVMVCNGDLVMLKASKGMALWRVAQVLGLELGEK